ncbi:FRG domain-containing protein [Microbacterium sp. NPDC056044]|uniref:FRG domain-containing protein n=1 Tax=Microbacterium sp. NPDC056044 TaxID=3345690 RepID=UPI0035E07033
MTGTDEEPADEHSEVERRIDPTRAAANFVFEQDPAVLESFRKIVESSTVAPSSESWERLRTLLGEATANIIPLQRSEAIDRLWRHIAAASTPVDTNALGVTINSLLKAQSRPSLYRELPAKPAPARSSRTVEQFFEVHEVLIDGVQPLLKELARAQTKHARLRPVWRGQQDASWAVRSSLSRQIGAAGQTSEDELIAKEVRAFATAERWGFPPSRALRFLADLQHSGAPTRLIDASVDPEIAVWFAVEAHPEHDQQPARVVGWGRVPAPRQRSAPAEPNDPRDEGPLPFWHAWNEKQERVRVEWGTGTRTWSWFPNPFNDRMRAQRAGFLFDAGPIISDPILAIFSEAMGADWRVDEITRATSVIGVPSRHDVVAKANDANIVPLFSFRITAEAKPAIREYLAQKLMTEHSVYPDFAGLVAHLRRH